MKLIIKWTAFLSLFLFYPPAYAQSNSVYNATTYAYTTQVTQGNTTTGATSLRADPTAFAQGIPFLPYNLNAPITIDRNSANAETVTPSALANCYPNSLTCTLSGTYSFKHVSGESIQSGTFGLQEAINVAVAAGSGTVLIDASWQGPAGSSLITAAKGSTAVLIQDNRSPSGATFYQWNGSQYALTGSASGLQSINGDTTPAQHFQASGSGLTVGTSGGVTTYSLAGGGITGTVATGVAGQLGGYQAGGTTIAPATGLWWIDSSMTITQINAVFAAANSHSTIIIGKDVPLNLQWTNPNAANVHDLRPSANAPSYGQFGVACDYNSGVQNLTITAGSNLVNIGADPYPVGGNLVFASKVGFGQNAVQQVWEPQIISYSFPNATLSGNAPFSYSGPVEYGTISTTQLQALLTATGAGSIAIPSGCLVLTGAVNWPGTTIIGSGISQGGFVGLPGQDIFVATTGASTTGATLAKFGLFPDTTFDATLGYTQWSTDGVTPTVVPPVYRPALNNTFLANKPLSRQWATAATNGVASLTSGSAVACIPNALGRVPANGTLLAFPYLSMSVLFNVTVLNQTGAGCAGGFTGITMSATAPATSAQAYYENATVFDVGETSISTSLTYPLIVTDSLIKAPTPNVDWSSPMGHVIVGNNSVRFEANYLGNNYSNTPGNGTITLREGPATISSSLTAGSYFIIPANPCTADYETPPFVLPNINGGSSVTPAGAVDIPGDCVGAVALGFLNSNGTTNLNGPVSGFLGPLFVGSSNGVNQGQNRTAALLQQGNGVGYSTSMTGWKIEFMEYGFVQGPTSTNEFGQGAVSPNSINDTFTNCQIHAAYDIVLASWEQSIIDGCDNYTTFFSPYDGTSVGSWTALAMSSETNEQTGAAVAAAFQDHTQRWQAEPEGGSGIASSPFAFVNCSACTFDTDVFEGGFNVFLGSNVTVQNSQIGTFPFIDWTVNSKFTNNKGLGNPFYMTNSWSTLSQWFNWGSGFTSCDIILQGQPAQPCASSYGVAGTGKSGASSINGINTVENIEGGNIHPGEMSYNTAFSAPVVDPTEPYWGKYVACFQVGGSCQENYFGGVAYLYIGAHNRITPTKYDLELTVRQTTGAAGTFQILFGAQDDGSGSCASAGQFGVVTIPITTSWVTQRVPVDFTGRQGCALQFIVETLANPVLIGEQNFIPQSNSTVITPPSDSIHNTSCLVNGTQYGVSATGYSYACVNGSILRTGPFS